VTRARRTLPLVALLALAACSRHDDPLTLAPAGVEVERRVLQHADVNAADEYGHSALHLAVYAGNATLVRALVGAGATVDARDKNDMTPLMIAAGGGACDVADALLASGADVRATTGPQRLQPTHLAVQSGTPEMTALLLRHGADVSARDSWDRTPLHLVAAEDWPRAAALSRVLAAAGADLSAKDARGFTPLHVAAENDCVPVFELYAGRAPALLVERAGTEANALDIALGQNSLLIADALFGAGVKPSDPTRMPPLLEAARFDDLPRAERVLAFREHPTSEYEGRSAIDVARQAGSAGVVELLSSHAPR
jgi:ankyrin repeat protein